MIKKTMITPQKLGKKLKILREESGYSQEQVSQILGIKRPVVAQIESGVRKVKPEELLIYSKLFDISVDSILKHTKTQRIEDYDYDKKKFENLVLYILTKCGAKPNLGKTVLYKLLYFSEFNFFEKYGRVLTGMPYIKLPMGPAPCFFDIIIQEMKKENKIISVMANYYGMYQIRLIPNQVSDEGMFSRSEKDVINKVVRKLSDYNASEISEYSHDDIPRKNTEDMQIIDYNLVKNRTPDYSVLMQENKLKESISLLQSTHAFDYLIDDPDLYDDYKV